MSRVYIIPGSLQPREPLTLEEFKRAYEQMMGHPYEDAPIEQDPAEVPIEHNHEESVLDAGDIYAKAVVERELGRLDAMRKATTPTMAEYRGEPWDSTTWEVCCNIAEVVLAGWNRLEPATLRNEVLDSSPRDAGFGVNATEEKFNRALREMAPRPIPPNLGQSNTAWLEEVAREQQGETASPPETVDVTNPAIAHDWLFSQVGRGPLNGLYLRSGQLVSLEGDKLVALTKESLTAKIQRTYRVQHTTKEGVKPAVFPTAVAALILSAPEGLPGVKELHGVITSPTIRPDGSILYEPGYDEASGLLLIPKGAQPELVPSRPTPEDLKRATGLLRHMLRDFDFVTHDDLANYIGVLLTPLLRLRCLPPYKFGLISAHQPGSGKSFLGRAVLTLHGGSEFSGLPHSDEEFGKTVATELESGTGGAAMFDNLEGTVRSSVLASLLTSPRFSTRRLGSNSRIDVANDRMWLATLNNAQIGGDLARRALTIRIDPAVPNPEQRTNFAISDWEGWVRDNRGAILWSLLVLVRHWISLGAPKGTSGSDSYAHWVSTVRGILSAAGVPGTFDAQRSDVVSDIDAEELEAFLAEAERVFGANQPWTARQLLDRAAPTGNESGLFRQDELPDRVQGTMRRRDSSPSRALGNWLGSKQGRFAPSGRVVRRDGVYNGIVRWRVDR